MNPYSSRFLTDEQLKEEKQNSEFDESKYTYCAVDNKLISNYKKHGRCLDILFSYLIQGCIKFYEFIDNNQAIIKPDIVKEYTRNETNKVDFIKQFLDECCDILTVEEYNSLNEKLKQTYKTPTTTLWMKFNSWAYENNCSAGFSKTKFFSKTKVRVDHSYFSSL